MAVPMGWWSPAQSSQGGGTSVVGCDAEHTQFSVFLEAGTCL